MFSSVTPLHILFDNVLAELHMFYYPREKGFMCLFFFFFFFFLSNFRGPLIFLSLLLLGLELMLFS